eukprot:1613680-Prymnesium_polylepis.1
MGHAPGRCLESLIIGGDPRSAAAPPRAARHTKTIHATKNDPRHKEANRVAWTSLVGRTRTETHAHVQTTDRTRTGTAKMTVDPDRRGPRLGFGLA